MTRDEFVRAYAERSNVPDAKAYPALGYIDFGVCVRIALPCACGDEICEGWSMVGIEQVLHHLEFYAPAKLREAYLEAVEGDGISLNHHAICKWETS